MLNKSKSQLLDSKLFLFLLLNLSICSLFSCTKWPTNTKALNDFQRGQSSAKSVISVEWRHPLGKAEFPKLNPHFDSGVAIHPRKPFIAIAGYDGKLRMLHAKTGNLIWSKQIKAVGIGKPVIQDDMIVLATEDGKLSAIDLDHQKTIWSKQFPAPVDHELIYDAKQFFVTDGTNSIYAIDRYSGEWLWQRKRETPEEFSLHGHSVPVYHQGKILMGFSDGHLSMFDAQSGQVIWDQDLSPDHQKFEDVDADAVVIQDIVYAASAASGLYALQLSDGKILWSYPLPGIVTLSKLDRDLVIGLQNGELMRFNPHTKQSKFRLSFDEEGLPNRPISIGNYLFFTLSRGGLYLINANTGKVHDLFSPGTHISKNIAITADGWLYASSLNGFLYAFSAH